MNRKFQHPIIVALDNVKLDNQTVALMRKLSGKVWGFKITDLHDRNSGAIDFIAKFGNAMVDVKLYDIPSTAANRARVLADQGASIITVHASGGHRMLEACIHAVIDYHDYNRVCWIAPVCILTSMEDDEVRRVYNIESVFGSDAFDRAFKNLVNYVFETYEDLDLINRPLIVPPNKLGQLPPLPRDSTILICPGIRPAMYTREDDQRNIDTPGNAMRGGADLLVIGRPIMESPDPVGAVAAIMAEVDVDTPWVEKVKDD